MSEWHVDYSTEGFVHPETGEITPKDSFVAYLDFVQPGWRTWK